MLSNIKFIFVVKNHHLLNKINDNFNSMYNIEVVKCDIAQIPYADCIVCPSNSYGIFEEEVLDTLNILIDNISLRIQNVINGIYYGEQPVGTTLLLDSLNPRCKFIAHTPFVRMYDAKMKGENAYLAFRSLLTAILNHNKMDDGTGNIITTIMIPLYDLHEMDMDEFVRQIRLAYSFIDLQIPASKENTSIIKEYLE